MGNPFIVRVKIVRRPEGEAPKWVRDCWIGVELNVIGDIDEVLNPKGVLSGHLVTSAEKTFSVP